MPKTIIHITDLLGIGGTEVLLKNTIPLLPEYNHVIVYLGGDNDLLHHFSNYPVHCLQHTGKGSFMQSVVRFRKIIKKYDADIIHSHLLWSGYIARFAKPKGVRLISSIHSVLSKDAFEKNRLSLWMEQLSAHRQNDVIGVSQFVIDDYLKHIPFKGKTHLLYNFIPASFYERSSVFDTDFSKHNTVRCVAVGNLKTVKNYAFILAAFKQLNTESFTLDIYGEGQMMSELKEYIADNNLPVVLKGSRNDLIDLLPQYQIFIQASNYEGFGLAIAEAVASGLIPVLSDIPVHREITANQAYYFKLSNPQNLTGLLLKLKEESVDKCRLRTINDHMQRITDSAGYLEQLRSIYNA